MSPPDPALQGPAVAPPTKRRATLFSVVLIVLFAVQPFVAFLADHWSQILLPGRVLLYAVATTAVALGAWALLTRVFKRPLETAAVGVAVTLFSFFIASWWLPSDARGWTVVLQLVLWLLATGAVVRVLTSLSEKELVRQGLLVFAAVYVLVPSINLVGEVAGGRGDEAEETAPDDPAASASGDLPNVYWFILDSYGREDQLDEVLDFDNREFTDALHDRGFEVSDSSRGSYGHTHLSLSSTLQMDYTVIPGTDITDDFAALGRVVRGDNKVVRQFKELGYQYIYSPQGWLQWSSCDEDFVDVCLPPRSTRFGVSELELSMLDLTPLGPLQFLGLPYTDPVWVMDEFDARRDEITEPYFMFAHVNAPHWPYRYDEKCRARGVPLDAKSLTLPKREQAYVQDIKCTNPLILDALDRIIEVDPNAIVILQSDHGSDFYSNYDVPPSKWDSPSLNEHFSVLDAARLPDRCDDLSFEGEPLVNTFRLVFACIEDRPPELIEWRAFLSPLDQVERIEEVPPERFGDGAGG